MKIVECWALRRYICQQLKQYYVRRKKVGEKDPEHNLQGGRNRQII